MDKFKLMVVDDNREFCNLVRDYVSMQEDVIFAGAAFDGISALELIKAKKPDVILMDNVMPELDGVGVLHKLCYLGLDNIPQVVLVSAGPLDTLISNADKLGIGYVMERKNDINEMIDRCRMVVADSFKKKALGERKNSVDVEVVVTGLLRKIGVPANVKGYSFLRASIIMVMKNPRLIHSVTKELYPEVAKLFESSSNKVERNIRNAIEILWKRGNAQELDQFFGPSDRYSKGRPTNSEFIATIADKLALELRTMV